MAKNQGSGLVTFHGYGGKHMSEQTNRNDEILAIIVGNRESEGIKLVKPEEFSRQLAYTNRPNGHETQPDLRAGSPESNPKGSHNYRTSLKRGAIN
jgi:hypothetical protein